MAVRTGGGGDAVVLRNPADRGGHGSRIAAGDQQHRVAQRLRNAADIGGDAGKARRACLQQRQRELSIA